MKNLTYKNLAKLALAVIILVSPILCNAAFEQSIVGARPAGLGGAYTAVSDDVYSVYYNPAGLARIKRMEFSAQYTKLHVGLDDGSSIGNSFIGVATPVKIDEKDWGTVGFSWLQFNLTNLYQENTMTLSYSKKNLVGKLDAGMNIKSMSLAYTQTDETMHYYDNDGNVASHGQDSLFAQHGYGKTMLDFDIGFQYQLYKNYKLGFSAVNLTQPNVSLENTPGVNLNTIYKIGGVHTGDDYSIGIDMLTTNFNNTSDWRTAIAGEKKLGSGLSLRTSFGIGSRDYLNFSWGIGYKTEEIQIDYALLYPLTGIKETLGSHRVSLILRFGPTLRDDDTVVLQAQLTEAMAVRQQTEKQLADAKIEIANAKAEIDELRGKIEKLLKEGPKKVVPAERTTTKEEKQAAPKKELPSDIGSQSEFKLDLKAYRTHSLKLSIPDRIKAIKKVINKWESQENVLSAQEEYDVLQKEIQTQTKNYKDTMDYYRRMTERGMGKEESVDLLKKIIKKYSELGIDTSDAESKLDNLQ
jgi:hypothetical protein